MQVTYCCITLLGRTDIVEFEDCSIEKALLLNDDRKVIDKVKKAS